MKVGIIANGPSQLLPNLPAFSKEIDVWIGADRGALILLNENLPIDYAIGDFDSMTVFERNSVKEKAQFFKQYPSEKNETDLELAIMKAMELNPDSVILFGVTGGRMDHTLVNIQILSGFAKKGINARIIDRLNVIHAALPGNYEINRDDAYPYISFVPLTPTVSGLTLKNFYYPLENEVISYGSTLCVSNKLIANYGTFSIREGIVLVIQSRDE